MFAPLLSLIMLASFIYARSELTTDGLSIKRFLSKNALILENRTIPIYTTFLPLIMARIWDLGGEVGRGEAGVLSSLTPVT